MGTLGSLPRRGRLGTTPSCLSPSTVEGFRPLRLGDRPQPLRAHLSGQPQHGPGRQRRQCSVTSGSEVLRVRCGCQSAMQSSSEEPTWWTAWPPHPGTTCGTREPSPRHRQNLPAGAGGSVEWPPPGTLHPASGQCVSGHVPCRGAQRAYKDITVQLKARWCERGTGFLSRFLWGCLLPPLLSPRLSRGGRPVLAQVTLLCVSVHVVLRERRQ